LLLQLGGLLLSEEKLLIESLPVLRRALLLGLSSLTLVWDGEWCWSRSSRLRGRRRSSRLDGLRRRVSSLDWLRSRPSILDGLWSGPSILDWLRSRPSCLRGRGRLLALVLVRLLYARRRRLFFSSPTVGRWRLVALVLVCCRGWGRRILLFPFVALRMRCGACADHQ
jgi:hypothetical protein